MTGRKKNTLHRSLADDRQFVFRIGAQPGPEFLNWEVRDRRTKRASRIENVRQAAQRHLLLVSNELEGAPGDDPPVDARDEIAVLGVENRAEKRQPRPQLYHLPAHRLDHP